MSEISLFLVDEAATLAAGAMLADAMEKQAGVRRWVVYLQGHLGAGKTTFSRGVIQGLGHGASVKSPTYTLVEPYDLACGSVFHFDLYRLSDPGELEYLGVQEYFAQGFLCLVEWPDKGKDNLPAADLCVTLVAENTGRRMTITGTTPAGESALKSFSPPAK